MNKQLNQLRDKHFEEYHKSKINELTPNKTEWIYRRGVEHRPTCLKLSWWQIIFFWFILDLLVSYEVEFVDFIDKDGNIRRVYPKRRGE